MEAANTDLGLRRRASASGDAPIPSTPISEPPRQRPGARTRRPFGQQIQKLAYPIEPGFHHHWFNDNGRGRIDRAKEAGYEHVIDNDGKPVKTPVGVTESGNVLIGYLMRIPQEWYDEDMAVQQAAVDETDRAIHQGAIAGRPGEDGRYVPSRGIKMWRK